MPRSWYIPPASQLKYTGSADRTNAAITRAQYDYYAKNFEGRERAFIDSILDGSYYEGVVEGSGADAVSAYSRGAGAADRSLSRYGTSVTSQQRRLLERLRAQGSALASVGAQNDARDVIHDTRLDVLSNLANVGRGVRTSASSGISQAAGLEANREAVNRQLAAQGRANRFTGAVSGAALGWTFGGPIGAVGGAILGGIF